MNNRFNIVTLSDLHVPFEDKKAIKCAFSFIKKTQPNVIILHELHDFYALSRFDKDPERIHRLQDEIDQVTKYLLKLKKISPKSRLILLNSNHLERLKKYLWKNAPAFSSLRSLQIEKLLELDRLNIEYKNYFVYKNFLFKHGNIVRQHSSYTCKAEFEREGMSGCSGHCFSEDTEVLTDNGWKLFSQIKIGDNVLTRNLENENSEWNIVEDVFSYDNYKELLHIKNSVVDLLVTPQHSLLYACRPHGKKYHTGYKRKQAKDCIKYDKIYTPNGGYNTNKEFPIDDDILRLLAWVITEGNISDSGQIRIAQSEKPKVGIKHITNICDRINQKYSVIKRYSAGKTEHGQHRNYNAYRINLNKSWITDTIIRFVPNKQIINDFWKLSERQFKLFFWELILADGNKNYDSRYSYQYSSKYENEIDALQFLCAYNGYRSSKIQRERNGQKYNVLTVNTKGYTAFQGKNIKKQKYLGKVWCATVKNKTLVVRRNGKVIVAGNSHRLGQYFTTKRGGEYTWLENGCLCDLKPEYIDGVANWQHGFTLVSFKGDRFTAYPIPIIKNEIFWAGKTY